MTRRLVTIALVLVAVAGTGIAVIRTTSSSPTVRPQPPPAVVEVAALIDGDTFDVRVNDVITRVRLAYVRTPPPTKPNQPPACLAADASARLASIIPPGTRLKLTYDEDRIGLPSAEAMTTDGRLVNAEIVRAGYAHVVKADLETPIPPAVGEAVNSAAQDALTNKRGMHSSDIACTIPGQVKALTNTVAAITGSPGPAPTVLDLSNSANKATEARMAAEELNSAFTQNRQDITWLALSPEERVQLQAQVQDARDQAGELETVLRNATNVAVNQDATQASTQRDAARMAKVLADLRKAEADRAARAARRVAAARKAQADALAETRSRAQAAQERKARARREASDSSSDRSSSSRGE
jgi:micrococcal nuclease